jgi:hypothetical protein
MKFRFLTDEFFIEYSRCSEIEMKKERPYAILCIVNYGDITFAIPIRHNIKHPFKVQTIENQGLDLSKTVVITDAEKYIDNTTVAYISEEEYEILKDNKNKIKKELYKYIKLYKKAVKKPEISRNKNIYEKSTLQYFHRELGIQLNENNSD